jgi:hypothetical protein
LGGLAPGRTPLSHVVNQDGKRPGEQEQRNDYDFPGEGEAN